jgi:NADPH-dependent 2,4-dienoyl-CoA reductase/sulfur reductase-like enzyme
VNPKYFIRSHFRPCDAMTGSSNNSDKVSQKDNGGVAGAPVSVLVVGAGPTGLLLASELD